MKQDVKKQILETIGEYKKLVEGLGENSVQTIIDATELITDSLKNGGCVYICGNGGSAADAQHIAGELVGRFRRERKALSAVALSTDTSVITSIANDYSYEDIFTRQVEAFVNEKDILWAISTSGTSKNVLAAAKLAKQRKASVLAFTGKENSPLQEISDVCFFTNAELTFQTQQIHQIAYHIICDIVEQDFC